MRSDEVQDVPKDSGDDKTVEHARWILDKLRTCGSASRATFEAEFNERKPGGEFARAAKMIREALAVFEVSSEFSSHHADLKLTSPFERPRYHKESFRTQDDVAAKEKIGETVAWLLSQQHVANMTCCLGSGSTVFHIAKQMIRIKPHPTVLFSTLNVAIAALWAEQENPPVDRISLPRSVLDTRSFRLETLQELAWSPSIAVIGADGLCYLPKQEKNYLYGQQESVAFNTNLLIRNTTHLVICCLTSGKIKPRYSGPPLVPPAEGVGRILVTDESPSKEIESAFSGWEIVAGADQWEHAFKRDDSKSAALSTSE